MNGDTSALLAVLLNEPEEYAFSELMVGASVIRLSAASYVEAAIYLDRNENEVRRAMLDTFIAEFGIQVEPVSVEQAMLARQAFVLSARGGIKRG